MSGESSSPQVSSEPNPPSLPYGAMLRAGLEKLTDQVLIFLLLYVMLLIGVSVFAPDMANQFRALLYIVPILGVVAFVWVRRRSLKVSARTRDVRVQSAIAVGAGTYVGGERGTGQDGTGATNVGSLLAAGGAAVIGRDVPVQTQELPRVQYLLEIFHALDELKQRKLIADAQRLLDGG
jgi:hypothetical protein